MILKLCKGGYLTVENALLQDNGIGVNTPGGGNIVQNTVIVGETANIGIVYILSSFKH